MVNTRLEARFTRHRGGFERRLACAVAAHALAHLGELRTN
jgi:hypothetical protein